MVVGAFATLAIVINALFMQSGTHPAPMFKEAVVAPKAANENTSPAPAPPSRRPEAISAAPSAPAKVAAAPAPRTPGEIINDIQRELARRGYYDGVVDGIYGPKTDAAIRDFEHASGLKPSPEPSEALLQAIMRSPAKKNAPVTTWRVGAVRNENAVERPQPSPRVTAMQRALAEYGYGQIKPSGIVDIDTQRAIERFERERKLPITGQATDRLMRELAAITGRPLE